MANPELSPYHPEVRSNQEECGVTAIFSKNGANISPEIPSLNRELQHRGYDSAGMAVYNGGINVHTGIGRVAQVFGPSFDYASKGLIVEMGIGHNRYGTSGEGDKDDSKGAQPHVAKWNGREVAIAFNGNIPDSLREILRDRVGGRLPHGKFDTVDIANAIVTASGNTWQERIKNALDEISLAFSLTILTDREEVFGLRSPAGTWPLWMGESDDRIIFASESRVDKNPGMIWKEVKPGELVQATRDGIIRTQLFVPTETLLRCALHDTYGAKEDSLMTEGVTYADFRRELGRELAREHPVDVDLVVGVPDTGLVIAEGYAQELNKKSTVLITKNGESKAGADRSFIAKSLLETSEIVHGKYKVNEGVAKDQRILLVDDSLIRGKTMGGDPQRGLNGVIAFARAAGAKEVHLAVVLPKFVNGCDMGYFIRKNQLVAITRGENGEYVERSEQEIAKIIKADSVHFLSIDGVKRAYEKTLGHKEVACMACMGQPHPLDIISRSKNTGRQAVGISS